MRYHLPFFALCFFFAQAQAQNYSLSFDGSSQYVSIPDQSTIKLSNDFTIEGWIYPTGPGSVAVQGGMIINKEFSYEIARFTDGTLQYALSANGAGTDWNWINSGLVAPLNTWSHFAFVKSGATVTFYLNGNVGYTSSTNPTTLTANTQQLRIGNRSSAGHYFNGSMDEIRIWNTARSQAELKNNMLNKNLSNSASGLVAYYRMNENTGTTTASASTNTSGLTGTLINAPSWSVSPVQFTTNSLSFDGTDDVVTIPSDNSLNISTAITLEAWVYATKNSGIQNVISKSNNTTNTGYIFPRTDNGWGSVVMYLYIGGAWRLISAAYPSLNVWHHLAATYDGATMKLYIDGILENTIAQTGTIAVNSNVLALGSQPGYGEYFGGYADELRVWNIARTQAQIQSTMNSELDPSVQTGLVSYYTMNQGITAGANTGLTTVVDQKGNNNGTLSNFSMNGSISNFVNQFTSLSILPVSWLSFVAQEKGDNIILNWSTTNEQNSLSFTIQHSVDGHSWKNIGNIAAAVNSSTIHQYSFLHGTPATGPNYYRILQQDLDGQFSYSKVIGFIYKNQVPKILIYPNPVTGGRLNLQLQQPSLVSVFTNNGVLVMRKQLSAGTQQINMNGLARGIYQLKAGEGMTEVIVP